MTAQRPPSCPAVLPCEDLLYIKIQGRAPRAGLGLAAVVRKRRATAALTVGRRNFCP